MGGGFQSTLRSHYLKKNRFIRQFRDSTDTRKSEYSFDTDYISPHITYANLLNCVFPVDRDDLFDGNVRRVLLVGSAGTGKTTFSLNSRYLWADGRLWRRFQYVYEVNLSKLINWEKKKQLCNSSPDGEERVTLCAEFLLHSLSEELQLALMLQLLDKKSGNMHGITIDSVKRTLLEDSSTVLIMFDGFDEITTDTLATKALALLLSVLEDAYCITTLRPEALDREIDGKTISSYFDRTYTIHGFDREGRNQYIKIQFPNDDESSELINLIDQSDFQEELNTPLLLEMYCHLWANEAGRNDLRTDFSIFQLYKQITDAHYDHFLNKCDLITNEERERIETFIQQSKEFLAEVAFNSLIQEKKVREDDVEVDDSDADDTKAKRMVREIDQQQLYQILTQEQRSWSVATSNRERRSQFMAQVVSLGIIRRLFKERVEHASELYFFAHKSFQEYFAALFVFYAYKGGQEAQKEVLRDFLQKFLEKNDSLRLTMSFFLSFCFRDDRRNKQRILSLVFKQCGTALINQETFYSIGPMKKLWFLIHQMVEVTIEDLPDSIQEKVKDLDGLLLETPFQWKELMIETGYVNEKVINYFLDIAREALDLHKRQSQKLRIIAAISTLPAITRQLRLWQKKRSEIFRVFLNILQRLVIVNVNSSLEIIIAILTAFGKFSLVKQSELQIFTLVKPLLIDEVIMAALPIFRNNSDPAVIDYLLQVASTLTSDLRFSTRMAAIVCLQKSLVTPKTRSISKPTKQLLREAGLTILKNYWLQPSEIKTITQLLDQLGYSYKDRFEPTIKSESDIIAYANVFYKESNLLDHFKNRRDDRSVLLLVRTLAERATTTQSVEKLLNLIQSTPNVVIQFESFAALAKMFYRQVELCSSRKRIELYKLIRDSSFFRISVAKALPAIDRVFSERSIWHAFYSINPKTFSVKSVILKLITDIQGSLDVSTLRQIAMQLNKVVRYFPDVISLGETTDTSVDLESLFSLLSEAFRNKQKDRSVFVELLPLYAYLDSLHPIGPLTPAKEVFMGLHPFFADFALRLQETIATIITTMTDINGSHRDLWSYHLSLQLRRPEAVVTFDSLIDLLSALPHFDVLYSQQYWLCKTCVDIIDSQEGRPFFPPALSNVEREVIRSFCAAVEPTVRPIIKSSSTVIERVLYISPMMALVSRLVTQYPTDTGAFPISEELAIAFYSKVVTTNKDPLLTSKYISFTGQCSLLRAIAALVHHYPQLASHHLYGMVYYGLVIEEMKPACYSLLLTLLQHHYYFLCEALMRVTESQRATDSANSRYRDMWVQIDPYLARYDQERVNSVPPAAVDITQVNALEGRLLLVPAVAPAPTASLAEIIQRLEYHSPWQVWLRSWLKYAPLTAAERQTAVGELFELLRDGLQTGLVQRLAKAGLDVLLQCSDLTYESDISVRQHCLVSYRLLLLRHPDPMRAILISRAGTDPVISEYNVLTKIISQRDQEDVTVRWLALRLFIALDQGQLFFPNQTGGEEKVRYLRQKEIQSFLLHTGLSDPSPIIQYLCLEYLYELVDRKRWVLPPSSLLRSCCSLLYHSDIRFVDLITAVITRILSSDSEVVLACQEVLFDWLLLQPEPLQRSLFIQLTASLRTSYWIKALLQMQSLSLLSQHYQQRSLAVLSLLRHSPTLLENIVNEIHQQQYPFLEIVNLYGFIAAQCEAQNTMVESLKFGLEKVLVSDQSQSGGDPSYWRQLKRLTADFSSHYSFFTGYFSMKQSQSFTIEKRKELENLLFHSQERKVQLEAFRDHFKQVLDTKYHCVGSSLFQPTIKAQGVITSRLLQQQIWEMIREQLDLSIRPLLSLVQSFLQEESKNSFINIKVKFLAKLLLPLAWNIFSVNVSLSERSSLIMAYLRINAVEYHKLLSYIFKRFMELPGQAKEESFLLDELIPDSLFIDQLGVALPTLRPDYFICAATEQLSVRIDTTAMLDLLRELIERLARLNISLVKQLTSESPSRLREVCQEVWRGVFETLLSFPAGPNLPPKSKQSAIAVANCLRRIMTVYQPTFVPQCIQAIDQFLQTRLPVNYVPPPFFADYALDAMSSSHHWLVSELLYLHQNDQLFAHLFRDVATGSATAAPSQLLRSEDFEAVIQAFDRLLEELVIIKQLSIEPHSGKHVFFSHDWGVNDQNHKRVKIIFEHIKKTCPTIPLWLDETHLFANMRDRICRAVQQSSCMLVFLTKNYSQKIESENKADYCYLEYNGASSATPKILVILDEDMKGKAHWANRIRTEHQNDLYYFVNPNDPTTFTNLIQAIGRVYRK